MQQLPLAFISAENRSVAPPFSALAVPVYRVMLVRDAELSWPRPACRCAEDVARLLRHYLANVDREHFVVVLLDRKHQVIGVNTVAVGSLTAAVVHPREVMKAAVLANAAEMILVHNHPSGDPSPSTEDQQLTTRLVQAGRVLGITVVDHIIIGDGTERYYSFADAGQLSL
jgi:DNA repair protein RadC